MNYAHLNCQKFNPSASDNQGFVVFLGMSAMQFPFNARQFFTKNPSNFPFFLTSGYPAPTPRSHTQSHPPHCLAWIFPSQCVGILLDAGPACSIFAKAIASVFNVILDGVKFSACCMLDIARVVFLSYNGLSVVKPHKLKWLQEMLFSLLYSRSERAIVVECM